MSFSKKREICIRMARFESPAADHKRVAKNTVVLYVRMLAVMAIGLYTGRVVFNALGVEDFGLRDVASGVIGMITFLMGSLSMASSRFLVVEMGRGTPGSLKRMFTTLFYSHLFLACVFAVLLETVGLYVLKTKLNIDSSRMSAVIWTFHCAVFTTFLGITQVPYSAIINGHERMSAFAWMTIYDVTVKLAIALAIKFYGGDRLMLLSTLNALSCLTTLMIYRIYCMRNFSEARIRKVFDRKMLAPIIAFAGVHILTQLTTMLLTQGLVMLNQRYFGPALVAAVAIGMTLNGHIQHFIDNFKAAANPQIIKLYSAKKFEEAKIMLTETFLFSIFLILLLGVPAWFYADQALVIWLGPTRPDISPLISRIILLGAFFNVFITSLYTILYAAGKIKENMYFNFVGGLMAFAIAVYLVRWHHCAIASVCVLSGWKVFSGLIFKPYLVHRVAGYGFSDYRPMFVWAFEALAVCGCIGWGVSSFMPKGLMWAIPSCAIIAALNGLAIYAFVAPDTMQQQARRVIAKVPRIGLPIQNVLSVVMIIAQPGRRFMQFVAIGRT